MQTVYSLLLYNSQALVHLLVPNPLAKRNNSAATCVSMLLQCAFPADSLAAEALVHSSSALCLVHTCFL